MAASVWARRRWRHSVDSPQLSDSRHGRRNSIMATVCQEIVSRVRWLFDSEHGAADRLISRWLFLRALGLIYFSAFFSLVFQIRGLIGPEGILPANEYLRAVTNSIGFA